MKVLIDTNILTRSSQPGHPMYQPAVDSVARLMGDGHDLCVVPQVLYEFWVVCTRPTGENGLGFSVVQTSGELTKLKRVFELLPDQPAMFERWESLVVAHDVKGKPAHDARLVAAMQVHGVTALLTFNGRDFARFAQITVFASDRVIHP